MFNLLRRMLLTAFGLLICAFGQYLTIQAGIGLEPWTCLSTGISGHVPVSFGTVHVIISLSIVFLDILLSEKIGFGTFLDALLVGTFIDMFTGLHLLMPQTGLLSGLGLMCIGLLIIAFGQFVYMKQGLSCGPRDSLTVGLGRLLPRVPIGLVQIGIMAIALSVGVAFGGPVGVGTIVSTFGVGIAMQIVFHLVHFEPRNVVHESCIQSIRKILS